MVKNPEALRNFELAYLKRRKLSRKKIFQLMDSLWEEAKTLGVLGDPLKGIETVIAMKRTINQCFKKNLRK